jgi:O-antigen ligase
VWIGLSGPAAAVAGKLALLAACVAAYVLARLCSRWSRVVVPGAVVGVVVGLVVSTGDLLSRDPLAGPLGYANANAALFVQGAIAAVLVVVVSRSLEVKIIAGMVAVGLVAIPIAVGSLAAGFIAVPATAALIVGSIAQWKNARSIVIGAAIVFAGALTMTGLLGAVYAADRGGPVDAVIERTLTERRVALWHDALLIMKDRPLAGVGAGGFTAASPVASEDRDARWAHNGFLQEGAEGGIPAFLLLAGLFLWAFWSLGSARGPQRAVVAIGVAALGVHASIDYILHFAEVPIVASLLLGAAMGARRESWR